MIEIRTQSVSMAIAMMRIVLQQATWIARRANKQNKSFRFIGEGQTGESRVTLTAEFKEGLGEAQLSANRITVLHQLIPELMKLTDDRETVCQPALPAGVLVEINGHPAVWTWKLVDTGRKYWYRHCE